MQVEVFVLSQCDKELREFPEDVIKELTDAIALLKDGITLTMPLSKSLSSVHKIFT
ncbi:MAG: hypothetical protein WC635_12040 [Bacteriovorax sp.]|jgi:hypothetical protein